eukprot:293811-Chlamydomonas_euryale.AAC.2
MKRLCRRRGVEQEACAQRGGMRVGLQGRGTSRPLASAHAAAVAGGRKLCRPPLALRPLHLSPHPPVRPPRPCRMRATPSKPMAIELVRLLSLCLSLSPARRISTFHLPFFPYPLLCTSAPPPRARSQQRSKCADRRPHTCRECAHSVHCATHTVLAAGWF